MFLLNLVTPDKRLATDLAIEEVIAPGFMGQLDILPGHAPLMTSLGTGVLKYRAVGSSAFETVVVSWGYLQVNPKGVVILAEVAESLEELDHAKVAAELKKTQAELLDPFLQPDQIEELHYKVAQANARLEALGFHSTNH